MIAQRERAVNRPPISRGVGRDPLSTSGVRAQLGVDGFRDGRLQRNLITESHQALRRVVAAVSCTGVVETTSRFFTRKYEIWAPGRLASRSDVTRMIELSRGNVHGSTSADARGTSCVMSNALLVLPDATMSTPTHSMEMGHPRPIRGEFLPVRTRRERRARGAARAKFLKAHVPQRDVAFRSVRGACLSQLARRAGAIRGSYTGSW